MSRQERIARAIQKEISSIIHDELKDPRIGFVTITKVQISPDMKYAQVFFSVFGQEHECQATKEALNSGTGFMRKLIAERINLRFAPEISFREDRSQEYSIRIQKVLDEIKELNQSRPTTDKKVGIKTKRTKSNVSKKSNRLPKKK